LIFVKIASSTILSASSPLITMLLDTVQKKTVAHQWSTMNCPMWTGRLMSSILGSILISAVNYAFAFANAHLRFAIAIFYLRLFRSGHNCSAFLLFCKCNESTLTLDCCCSRKRFVTRTYLMHYT
jgi:hypothetical protein